MSGNVAHLPPLWWVARRSVRLLTCLAIAVLALSAWSAQQPTGASAADSTPYATVLPVPADVRHSPAVRSAQPAYVPTVTAAPVTGTTLADPSGNSATFAGPSGNSASPTGGTTAPAGDSATDSQPAEADQGRSGSAGTVTSDAVTSGAAARPAGPRAPPHPLT